MDSDWSEPDYEKHDAKGHVFTKRTLYFKNFHFNQTSIQRLKELFESYGPIEVDSFQVYAGSRPQGPPFGFLRYKELHHARNAVESLNGSKNEGLTLALHRAVPPVSRSEDGVSGRTPASSRLLTAPKRPLEQRSVDSDVYEEVAPSAFPSSRRRVVEGEDAPPSRTYLPPPPPPPTRTVPQHHTQRQPRVTRSAGEAIELARTAAMKACEAYEAMKACEARFQHYLGLKQEYERQALSFPKPQSSMAALGSFLPPSHPVAAGEAHVSPVLMQWHQQPGQPGPRRVLPTSTHAKQAVPGPFAPSSGGPPPPPEPTTLTAEEEPEVEEFYGSGDDDDVLTDVLSDK